MIEGPALGIRFDTEKVESAAYGLACWEVFWRAVDPRSIEGALLFDGDTSATLAREESVFCIAVQADPPVLREVSSALGRSEPFWQVAASTPFVEEGVHAEPLVEAGRVLPGGELEGGMWSRSALEAVSREGVWAKAAPEPLLCPNCGSEVEPGDRFCMTCGNPLPEQAAEATQPMAPVPVPLPTPPPRRSLRTPLIVGGAVIVLLALGFAVFAGVFSGDEPVAQPTTTLAPTTTRAPTTTVAATTTRPAPVLVTAADVETCLVDSGLDPILDTGQIANRVEAMGVFLPSGGGALIFVYENEADVEGAVTFLADFFAESGELKQLGNVVVTYDTEPDPSVREAIESCATGGGAVTVERPPTTTGPASGEAELDTGVGMVLVADAYTTDEYPLDCRTNGEDFCDATSSEERIVVVLLEHEKGSFTENEADALVDEAFESFLIDGQGFTVDSFLVAWSTDFQGGVGTITEIEVVYTFLPADLPTTIELNWPGHDPIDLTPLIED